MNKSLIWKIVLIVVLVLLALWELYPPQHTLKQGLDLGGGTSIIYDIDTSNLDKEGQRDLAERTIKVLRRRIDPTNIMNLEWVAHGNSRIEIKMPLASQEIVAKRIAYNETLDVLEEENINLALVRRTLDKVADVRVADFEKYSRNDAERLAILNELAMVYDQRKALQSQRDELAVSLEQASEALEAIEVEVESLDIVINEWAEKDGQELADAVKDFIQMGDPNAAVDSKKVSTITGYQEAYKKWFDVVNQLTDENDGLNIKYQFALGKLDELNLSTSQVVDVLELEPSRERTELIEQMLSSFSDRKDKIEVVIAAFDEYRPYRGRLDGPEDLKRMLKGAGVLEFRIIPTPGDEGVTEAALNNYISNLKRKGPQAASDSRFMWAEIENIEEWKTPGSIVQPFGKKFYVLASNNKEEVMLANQGGKEWKLRSARPTSDSMGRGAIGFGFDTIAGNMFYKLTSSNIGRPLCILLDGIALSAPNIESAISTNGIITGKFNPQEIQDMVSKLDAGSLKARLIEPPVSENTIGPGIGEDNREKGKTAAIYGLAAVAVFMAIYYFGSGLIAVLALVLNIIFILSIMAFSNATFTLPGIAGIILTIGMSVDANVLIFERIREELDNGASLKIAVDNGYSRAFRTILDANITTFITAAILFYVASEEIKGFAVTLMIGIVCSMFTALFVTRVIFNFLLDARVLKDKLPMVSKLIRRPKIAWMSAKPVFMLVSLVLVLGGLTIFTTRDDAENSKYDIEFTGGTSVNINLKNDVVLDRDEVEDIIRGKGAELNNPLLQRAKVYSVGTAGTEYEISTIETNKTTAIVSFTEAPTSGQIDKLSYMLENLTVENADDDSYVVMTTQLNQNIVKDAFAKVFGEAASVGQIQVDEVVTNAIKEAFAGKMKVLENLNPQITSTEKVTVEIVETYPEIARFLGGVKIVCKLERAAAADQIISRFEVLRSKPDLAKLTRSPYKLLRTDFSEIESDGAVDEFVFVAVKTEAAGADMTAQQFEDFASLQKKRVMTAGELETSLSRVNQIAPSIGKQAKTQALIAIVLSLIAIVTYVWIRFGTARYGFAAIAALVHDVIITLGVVVGCTYVANTGFGRALGIQDFKISLETIAAFLTIIGYSLNDTIVVFDRIRENRGSLSVLNKNMINNSINQTLSRTILTSFTTFLVVLIMYIFGGAGLRGFTFAMLIGIIVGTYSSIAIAAPILIFGKKKSNA